MIDIATHVKTLGAQYAAVIALAETIESIGSIEQATAESTAAAIKATDARVAAVEELAKVNALVESAKEALLQAEQKAADIISEATMTAAGVKQSAQEDADAMLGEARDNLFALDAEFRALTANVAALRSDISDKQKEFDGLVQSITDAKAEAIAKLS
jgi:cell division septum initiation protein DivIVA